jgi:hypothetical protein
MNALVQDLGDDRTYTLPLTTPGTGAPFSSTGQILVFSAKFNKDDLDPDSAFQKALGAGLTASGTNVLLDVLRDDTINLTARTLYCDVQAQDVATQKVKTVWKGVLKLSRDITRQTSTSVDVKTASDPLPIIFLPGWPLLHGAVTEAGRFEFDEDAAADVTTISIRPALESMGDWLDALVAGDKLLVSGTTTHAAWEIVSVASATLDDVTTWTITLTDGTGNLPAAAANAGIYSAAKGGQGQQGMQGMQGDQGDQGEQGEQGPQGLTGFVGNRWQAGDHDGTNPPSGKWNADADDSSFVSVIRVSRTFYDGSSADAYLDRIDVDDQLYVCTEEPTSKIASFIVTGVVIEASHYRFDVSGGSGILPKSYVPSGGGGGPAGGVFPVCGLYFLEKGDIGPQGPTGETGPTGATGATGATGTIPTLDISTETGTTRTLTTGDIQKLVHYTNASGCAITITTDAVGGWATNAEIAGFRGVSAGALTLSFAGVTLHGSANVSRVGQGEPFGLKRIGTDTWAFF